MVNQRICVYFFQAFLTLARDIKAKIDKKLVRTSQKRTCYKADRHTLNICAMLIVLSCVYRRATTRRGAVKESRLQISPRKAASSAARCCEETGAWAPTIALTVSPTGQNWTEHKDQAFLFHFTFVFFLSLNVLCLPWRRKKNKLVPLSWFTSLPSTLVNRTTVASATSQIRFIAVGR